MLTEISGRRVQSERCNELDIRVHRMIVATTRTGQETRPARTQPTARSRLDVQHFQDLIQMGHLQDVDDVF